MSIQSQRLQHRLNGLKQASTLIQTCRHLRLNETEYQHLCDSVFTTDDAPDVLASFLKQHHQSVEKGEGYLLSLIPRKPEKALEDPYFTAVWGTWIVSFLRFVRSFGRFRF